jgi:hypothetical protein
MARLAQIVVARLLGAFESGGDITSGPEPMPCMSGTRAARTSASSLNALTLDYHAERHRVAMWPRKCVVHREEWRAPRTKSPIAGIISSTQSAFFAMATSAP